MDQFWFPNGKERQNCTVSAPPDILRPVQFSVSVPNRISPSSDFGNDGSQRRESASSAPPAQPILKITPRANWTDFGFRLGATVKFSVKSANR